MTGYARIPAKENIEGSRVQPVVAVIKSVIKGLQALDNVRSRVGPNQTLTEWVADDPSNLPFWERPFQSLARGHCDRLATLADGYGDPGNIRQVAAGTAFCDDYFMAGQAPVYSGNTPPTVPGGQCQGAPYRVELTTFRASDGGNPQQQSVDLNGPISVEIVQDPPPVLNTVRVTGSNGVQNYKLANSVEIGFSGVSVTRLDGQPDDCGDSGDGGPGTYSPGPNPPMVGPDSYEYEDPDGGPPTPIVIGPIVVGPGGEFSLTGTIGDVTVDIAPFFNIGGDGFENEPANPDFARPSGDINPGPGGNPDGSDNPAGGIDSNGLVAAVLVVITAFPPDRNIEVSTVDDVAIPGQRSDFGWFRWKSGTGDIPYERLTQSSNLFIYNRCPCCEAGGFEVKFSEGVQGFAVTYPCEIADE